MQPSCVLLIAGARRGPEQMPGALLCNLCVESAYCCHCTCWSSLWPRKCVSYCVMVQCIVASIVFVGDSCASLCLCLLVRCMCVWWRGCFLLPEGPASTNCKSVSIRGTPAPRRYLQQPSRRLQQQQQQQRGRCRRRWQHSRAVAVQLSCWPGFRGMRWGLCCCHKGYCSTPGVAVLGDGG
jgi:hypothetical protein